MRKNARAAKLRRLSDFQEASAWTLRAGNDFFRFANCVEKKLSLFRRLHAKIQRRAQLAKFQRLWWSFPVFVCVASRRARAQMFRETRKETFSRLKIKPRSTRKQSSELCKKLAFVFVYTNSGSTIPRNSLEHVLRSESAFFPRDEMLELFHMSFCLSAVNVPLDSSVKRSEPDEGLKQSILLSRN